MKHKLVFTCLYVLALSPERAFAQRLEDSGAFFSRGYVTESRSQAERRGDTFEVPPEEDFEDERLEADGFEVTGRSASATPTPAHGLSGFLSGGAVEDADRIRNPVQRQEIRKDSTPGYPSPYSNYEYVPPPPRPIPPHRPPGQRK